MTEILFYHLEQSPLHKVLPVLLDKTLQRGWRAVVQSGNPDTLEHLDQALWTWRDDSFLPHGVAGNAHNDAAQPVLLTNTTGNPNGAQIRFFVEGAVPVSGEAYERIVFMFDGHNPEAVQDAREAWKALRDGNEVTYWQQEASGRWVKKA